MDTAAATASGRPLRDLGRFAVDLLADPIAAFLNRGREEKRHTTAREVRSDARARPRTEDDALVLCVLRLFAWLGIFVVSMPLFVVAATLRGPVPLMTELMMVTTVSGMFSSSAAFFQVGRLTLIRMIGMRGFPPDEYTGAKPTDKLSRRHLEIFARQGGRSNRFMRWLCSPSHWDAGFAVLWTLMFAPLLIQDFTS